jgi:Zn-dependent peptidase ImmA (M78 family)/DNA-binding XRE family transcriptional regulator
MPTMSMLPGMGMRDNVNPEMVILGRQTRGLTQIQLAGRMGVAQSTVSKIEAGLQPSDDELANLAAALELPSSFFTQWRRVPGPGLAELFHRKRASLGAKKLHHIHAQAAIRLLSIQDLLRSWEDTGDDVNIPKMPIDQYDWKPEKIARTVRALWQLPPGPVMSMTEVIERFGGIIFVCDFETSQIDGFSRRWDDLPPTFFMNSTLMPDRWRWTLAHELGHMVMHVDVVEGEEKDREDEANRFAGEFLAPAHELKPQLFAPTLPKLAGLKRYWKISIQALLVHSKRIGAIGESQLRNMLIQLGKAGYKLREPAELDPPAEPPQVVGRIIDYHMKQLGYSESELLEALKIDPQDLRMLLNRGGPSLRVVG